MTDRMTRNQYRQALSTLNLTQGQAAKWLGVSLKTSHLYARNGPSGPAARAVSIAVALRGIDRFDEDQDAKFWLNMKGGDWIKHADLTAAIGLDKIRPELK